MGTGSRSAILRAMTRGSGPLAPQTDALTSSVASDPSTLILHLDHWFSAGCPIHYVRIEKKGPLDAAWSVLTSSVDPDDQPMFKLHDFAPDDVYHLKLTASTDAGSQTVLYTVQRLSRKSSSPQSPCHFCDIFLSFFLTFFQFSFRTKKKYLCHFCVIYVSIL